MNKRIQELIKEATEFQKIPYDGIDGVYREAFVFNKEKFAELIVKECANVFWSEDCNTSDLALEEYNRNSKKIKRHFGVEE